MITIIVGNSDADAASTAVAMKLESYVYAAYAQHPRDLMAFTEDIYDGYTVITNSLFLIRELYMKARRENIPLRYAYKGEFFDDLPEETGILEAELDQSSRYMDVENES